MAHKMTFDEACRLYVHRYTMEHKPQWAHDPAPNGKMYAPQYRSDREWYDNTLFGKDAMEYGARRGDCVSRNQTWPLGHWLEAKR